MSKSAGRRPSVGRGLDDFYGWRHDIGPRRRPVGVPPGRPGVAAERRRPVGVELPPFPARYHPTPLVEAPGLAADLQVGAVWVKDESNRMGLPAFKVLGASWAVNCALRARDGAGPADSLSELQRGLGSGRPTLVTATDGNHGRAVAWMAHLLDLPARIYVPAVISAVAIAAIAAEGAEVVQTDLVYDDVVALAASSCVGPRRPGAGAGHLVAGLHRHPAANRRRLRHPLHRSRRAAGRGRGRSRRGADRGGVAAAGGAGALSRLGAPAPTRRAGGRADHRRLCHPVAGRRLPGRASTRRPSPSWPA